MRALQTFFTALHWHEQLQNGKNVRSVELMAGPVWLVQQLHSLAPILLFNDACLA